MKVSRRSRRTQTVRYGPWNVLPNFLADFLWDNCYVPGMRLVCKSWCKEWDDRVTHIKLECYKVNGQRIGVDRAVRALKTKFPRLCSLSFRRSTDGWPQKYMHGFLEQLPGMAFLTELCFQSMGVDNIALRHVSALTNLRKLDVSSTRIRNLNFVRPLKNLVELSACGCGSLIIISSICALNALRKINFGDTRIDDRQSYCFSKCQNLTELKLKRTLVSSRLLKQLCNCTKLTSLDLSETSVTADSIEELSHLVALETLDLGTVALHGVKIAPLVNLTKLRTLGLEGLIIGDDGVHVLTGLHTLTALAFRPDMVSEDVFPLLSNLSQLELLVLENDRFASMQPLNWGHLPQLKHLSLSCWDDASLKRISRLENLEVLNAGEGSSSVACLSYLTTLQGLTKLVLDFEPPTCDESDDESNDEISHCGWDCYFGGGAWECGVLDNAVEELLVLTSLKELVVPFDAISEGGIETMHGNLPHCTLSFH